VRRLRLALPGTGGVLRGSAAGRCLHLAHVR